MSELDFPILSKYFFFKSATVTDSSDESIVTRIGGFDTPNFELDLITNVVGIFLVEFRHLYQSNCGYTNLALRKQVPCMDEDCLSLD